MSFLIDTCVVSELARTQPDPGVLRWLDGQAEESLFLSVLSLGELEKGAAKVRDVARRRSLLRWIRNDLQRRFVDRLLPVDAFVASRWGALCGEAERTGRRLPVIDSLLAATALVHSQLVVTRNVADFEACGAACLDPWLAR